MEHNLRLVAHIVKKFDPNPQDIEDMISIGSIGLVSHQHLSSGQAPGWPLTRQMHRERNPHAPQGNQERQTELHLLTLSSEDDDGEVSTST